MEPLAITAAFAVIATSTAPSIAPPLDLPDAAQDDFRTRVMRLTCIAGLSGLPQMSIPSVPPAAARPGSP